ncbi:Golgi-associated plant pathogenesis-related protein 1-like [Symsagittifera roscoffensis]|uniref:Golgi-associated plant pathogenesis-related protein 1-like n=1 Tax=Symsagittifera roscoffensis TaxID=84072 RepID=UPI00307B9C7E
MGGGMSTTGREALNQTNHYRRQHHAGDLTWDKSAARHASSLAKKIARTGRLEHSGSKKFGENLAMGTTMDGKRAVDLWYAEVNKYSFGNSNFQPGCGHFTALVWKGTGKMGVGRARRRDGSEVVVANFLPPGNMQGRFKENVLPK